MLTLITDYPRVSSVVKDKGRYYIQLSATLEIKLVEEIDKKKWN